LFTWARGSGRRNPYEERAGMVITFLPKARGYARRGSSGGKRAGFLEEESEPRK